MENEPRVTYELNEEIPEKKKVPALTLNGTLIFPYALTPLVVEGRESIELVRKAADGDRLLALFPELPEGAEEKRPPILEKCRIFKMDGKAVTAVGVLGRIVKLLNFPDGSVRVLIRGLARIAGSAWDPRTGKVSVKQFLPDPKDEIEATAMARNAVKQFQEITGYSSNFPEELKIAVLNMKEPARIVDLIADSLNIGYVEKIAILATPVLRERLQLLTIFLNRELEVLKLSSDIQKQVHNAMSKSQREFFLREQLRTIREELGEETRNPDLLKLAERLKKLDAPDTVRETVQKEIDRLQDIPPAAPEYTVSYNYVDWILSLPWNVRTEDRLNVDEAAAILDRDHYGLKDVKERILEFLSVLQLKKNGRGPILCFSGPPGVGKTSLGHSIADAMGRKFIRISLGGIKDEAEIRGHRRTYIGALPGRIIQGIKKAGSSNPVFMLDELDKIGSDFRGDPASALLEVLDPQQNCSFNDHFLELDYDLSGVMFIATANLLDPIPAPLLDRMDIITLPGYTPFEKHHIAERFLIPRQLVENGIENRNVSLTGKAVDDIISLYTREAGVRTLERTIGTVFRKTARKIVSGTLKKAGCTIGRKELEEALGAPKFLKDEIPAKPVTGLAVGMAWTSVGGTILCIETLRIAGGKGELKLTGSLGNVMKESALAAFSYIRSVAESVGIDPELFKNSDFHIHVPDGATPKDGPSAGVTISTALVSLLTGHPVCNKIAMTGEITLRGSVTAVGGIKEKIIGAMRSGVTDIILPEQNRKDLEEIPDEVRKALFFHFVKEASAAWAIAIPGLKKKKTRK